MRCRCCALLFVFAFAELAAMGQIGSPGLGLPRIGKKKTSKAQKGEPEQLVTVTGVLREMDLKQIIVEAQDTRIINLKRSENTKFLKDGDEMKALDLKPGDHLMIEANQDREGFFFAVNVMLEKGGTADAERLAFAFRRVVARMPTEGEAKVLAAALDKQRKLFAGDRASALKLLKVGDSPRNEKLDVVEHAAFAAVCLMMLNLDEALNK